MIEEIIPHPDLIDYYKVTDTFTSNLSVTDFTNFGENYNILSDINQNIFLLKQLDELGLLKETNRICDCGLGLGNALFELYLQSKEINKRFYFTGIEKQKVYVDFILENLSHLWKDNLNLVNSDIMNIDYLNFDIIYSYSPFNNYQQLRSLYQKVISEISPGSIIVEHANFGLGHFNLLEEFTELQKIELEQIYVFKKIQR